VVDDTEPPEMPPVVREFHRIFGDPTTPTDEPRPFLMLPLQGDEDALAFLRTVPTGTPWEALLDLAVAYRAAHPGPPDAPSSASSRRLPNER
jgi:hypothetical protein